MFYILEEEKVRKLSIKGLILSVLAVLVLEAINQFIAYQFDFAFLQTYFYLGWLIYAWVFGTVYHHFKTGHEQIGHYIFVCVVNILMINLTMYVSDLLFISSIFEVSFFNAPGIYPFTEFISTLYLETVTLGKNANSGIELPGWVFEIPGYIVMTWLACNTMKSNSDDSKGDDETTENEIITELED